MARALPTLSFVVPSLNQGRFIGACLDSIAAQELPTDAFEVWVIDGASTDETLDVLRTHPLRPQWISEPDAGHWDAVNKGIRRSRGDIICWINSDDVYLPGALPQVREYFSSHPECEIVYGEADYIDEEGQPLGRYGVEDWNHARLADVCYICQPAALFRRRVPERFGLLTGEFPVALDLEYWMRIGTQIDMTRVPFRIACSRLWGGTKSTLQQLQMQRDALRIGYRYAGHWSRRRRWAVSENRLLGALPGLRRRMAEAPDLPTQAFFWAGKSLLYAGLSLSCTTRSLRDTLIGAPTPPEAPRLPPANDS